ncbi:hypothetical protein ABZ845_25515 [Streptomyces sp. NPDC047022]|uniref:hypothetical protein n=1 Tax=Streptomyces sp. NPDC047022 TaxID=3155737 RepID=UPI0033D7D425
MPQSMVTALARNPITVPAAVLRSCAAKEAEVLALRHEKAVLRRQIARVHHEPADRIGFAMPSRAADADEKGPLYDALGVSITYDNATRTATVRSSPSIPYRYGESSVRGAS